MDWHHIPLVNLLPENKYMAHANNMARKQYWQALAAGKQAFYDDTDSVELTPHSQPEVNDQDLPMSVGDKANPVPSSEENKCEEFNIVDFPDVDDLPDMMDCSDPPIADDFDDGVVFIPSSPEEQVRGEDEICVAVPESKVSSVTVFTEPMPSEPEPDVQPEPETDDDVAQKPDYEIASLERLDNSDIPSNNAEIAASIQDSIQSTVIATEEADEIDPDLSFMDELIDTVLDQAEQSLHKVDDNVIEPKPSAESVQEIELDDSNGNQPGTSSTMNSIDLDEPLVVEESTTCEKARSSVMVINVSDPDLFLPDDFDDNLIIVNCETAADTQPEVTVTETSITKSEETNETERNTSNYGRKRDFSTAFCREIIAPIVDELIAGVTKTSSDTKTTSTAKSSDAAAPEVSNTKATITKKPKKKRRKVVSDRLVQLDPSLLAFLNM